MNILTLFKKYPPRDIEVSVYGVTQQTYETITKKPGSFAAFERGLELLLQSGIKVRFKAMALRSNVHELSQISDYCRKVTKDYFRFDPLLHLRFDGDPKRNEEIKAERLSPEEIVAIERADPERFESMEKGCDKLIVPEFSHYGCNHLFHCGAGNGSFCVSYDGKFRLCSSLWHPDCIYDLRKGSLEEAWSTFIPQVRDMRSDRQEFLEKCRRCQIINLCMWCPAHSHLETGEMDSVVDYFCQVAHARAKALKRRIVLFRMNNPAHSMKKRIARIVIRIQSFPLYKLIRTSLKPEIQVTEASVSDWDKVHEILNPNASDSPPQSGANVTNYVAKISNKIVGHVQLVAAQKRGGFTGRLVAVQPGCKAEVQEIGYRRVAELQSCTDGPGTRYLQIISFGV